MQEAEELLPPTAQYLCDHRYDEHGACEYLLVLANNERQWVPEVVIDRHARRFNELHWYGNMGIVDMWVATMREQSFLRFVHDRGHYREEDGHFVFDFEIVGSRGSYVGVRGAHEDIEHEDVEASSSSASEMINGNHEDVEERQDSAEDEMIDVDHDDEQGEWVEKASEVWK